MKKKKTVPNEGDTERELMTQTLIRKHRLCDFGKNTGNISSTIIERYEKNQKI